MQKKISEEFIVPNRSLDHTDHLYTYKGYVDHVGFTEKRQKLPNQTICEKKDEMSSEPRHEGTHSE